MLGYPWRAGPPRGVPALSVVVLASLWLDRTGASAGSLAGGRAGYVLQDPRHFDDSLGAEVEFDRDRSARECFCGSSPNVGLWQRFYIELQAGLAANPTFRGDWVHRLCGMAYPAIFRVVSVDPRDDTFVLHTDCPAGVLAMVIVCAQSAALEHTYEQRQEAPHLADGLARARGSAGVVGPFLSNTSVAFWRLRRVARDEGGEVYSIIGPMPLDECIELCASDSRCKSFAHGPHGCHEKNKCMGIEEELVPDAEHNSGYYTYYRADCAGPEPAGAAENVGERPPAEVAAAPERNTNLQELQNMMMFAIRALEFCFHCLDQSPWPFTTAELMENYALAAEAPEEFLWQRPAGRALAEAAAEEQLPSVEQAQHVALLAQGVGLVLQRLRVRWARGLENEASFWRKKLSPDPALDSSLGRLQQWLDSGEVTWAYDDLCTYLLPGAGALAKRPPRRVLNAGSGPFAPGPLECQAAPEAQPIQVPVVAADGLARFYLRVLDQNGYQPLYSPLQCPVEELHRCFPPAHFDLVHIRNALDHAFDPLLGVERMLHVVQPGGWVLLRHARNEGAPGKFRNGLHQWCFDVAETDSSSESAFVIWNPDLRVDVSSYLLSTGLAAEVRTELRDHPSDDAPPDEKYVWVDIRRPTIAEAAARGHPAANDS